MGQLSTTGFWMDGEDAVIRRSQDVEPILEHCKALRSVGATGSSEMKHAAKLPNALIEKYLATHPGVTMQDMMRANSVHIREMLNDPDLQGFRIWQGRI